MSVRTELSILITSFGRREYLLDFYRDSQIKVHIGDCQHVPAFESTPLHILLPRFDDLSYLSVLIDYCLRNEIRYLTSLFDPEVNFLALNEDELVRNGITLLGPDSQSAIYIHDKYEMWKYLPQFNVACIPTFRTVSEVEIALSTNQIAFPLLIKPRFGYGSLGQVRIDSVGQLRSFAELIISGMNKSDLSNLVIQPWLEGPQRKVTIFSDLNGNFRSVQALDPTDFRYGETFAATILDPSPFEILAKRIAQAIKVRGIFGLDVLINNGIQYVLDINARIEGSYPFFHLAGLDYLAQIREWHSNPADEDKFLNARIGVRGYKKLTPTLNL